MPRPLTPMTATRMVSLGDCVVRRDVARKLSPAAVVCLTKSRRSMSLIIVSESLLQYVNLDITKPDHVVVILEHDLAFSPHGEPGRIVGVLALCERRVE